MRIRGYDITEKRVAAVCAVILLVVSLFAAIKQANAAADTANLLDSKEQQKSSKPAEQKLKIKPDSSAAQQLVPQKNNANAANTNKDIEAAKKAAGSQGQSDKKNEAEKKNKPDDKTAQPAANKPKSQPSSYSYTVQDGDSYATVVRRAISEHGGSGLNPAQKIAAETKLAEQAGWPEVDTGQTVKIDSAALSQAIDSARSMTADEQQSWQAYADEVVW